MTKLSNQIALEKKSKKRKTNGLTEGAFQNPEVASKTGHFEILMMKY